MKAKEKLQDIIFESFIVDDIGEDRFRRMTKKVENISESNAKQILNELMFFKDDIQIGSKKITTNFY